MLGASLAMCAILATAGCRTRLYDNDGIDDELPDAAVDLAVPRDLAMADLSVPPDLARPDMARPDLARPDMARVPDLTFLPDLARPPDLTVLPDLMPPPDLVSPRYCDGIFVFDIDRRLSFFDPKKLTFTDLTILSCPAGNASPFSMALSRTGTAYVEYNTGALFTVDTVTGVCKATGFMPGQAGFTTFGMGFAADAQGSTSETLYMVEAASSNFGRLNLQTFVPTTIGQLPGVAELTGTGAGDLWGFFGTQTPFIGHIDKTSGTVLETIDVTGTVGDASSAGYAFGFFGGNFYIFIHRGTGSTNVYRVNPQTNGITQVLANTGRHVVGAGVSTCAPQM